MAMQADWFKILLATHLWAEITPNRSGYRVGGP